MINRISFKRKTKRNLGTFNRPSQIVPKTPSEVPSRGVLRKFSKGLLLEVDLRRSADVRLGRPWDVRSGRPQDVRSGRGQDGQIGPSGDVLGMMEEDVLETSWGPKVINCMLNVKAEIIPLTAG